MLRAVLFSSVVFLAFAAKQPAPATAPVERVLWHDPAGVESLDLGKGPGDGRLPEPPFSFIEEDKTGTSPKMKVRDANGRIWRVKFGNEASPDVFGSRLAWACGYLADTSHFLRFGHVEGVRNPGRIAAHLKDGHFLGARFALSEDGVKPVESESWTWQKNPFAGTRELNGLKILTILLSNWDNKDGRDEHRGANTVVLDRTLDGKRQWVYGVTDWGATMGKWGGFGTRNKWDCRGFSEQTRDLIKGVRENGIIEWGYKGQHTDTFSSDIRVEDVRWLMQRLGRISDAQIRAALEASGATAVEQDCFTEALRERISRLAAI